MAELVAGGIVIFIFLAFLMDEVTKPSPERKLEDTAAQGSQEIQEIADKYRNRIEEILEDE